MAKSDPHTIKTLTAIAKKMSREITFARRPSVPNLVHINALGPSGEKCTFFSNMLFYRAACIADAV